MNYKIEKKLTAIELDFLKSFIGEELIAISVLPLVLNPFHKDQNVLELSLCPTEKNSLSPIV